MFQTIKTRFNKVRNTVSRRSSQAAASLLTLLLASRPVAAQSATDNCTVPGSFDPLFSLLDTLAQIALAGGIAIGTIGLLVAAIYIMAPGQDSTRTGKSIAKHVVIGSVLLLSANMIMSFLTSQLGTALCA